MKFSNVMRFARTISYLKSIQLVCRLTFNLYRPQPEVTPAPRLRPTLKKWKLPYRRKATMITSSTFSFFGDTCDVRKEGWDNPKYSKLLRYNLHYFDDLNAIDSQERTEWHKSIIISWIESNPPAQGTGWEPYPLSLRLVNWIKWIQENKQYLDSHMLHSMAIQVRHLNNRIEWHLLGNHLFVNAKALIFAGMFFEGKEANKWLKKGMAILAKQVPEQILKDGGHFELSPMYHSLAVEDLLDLINIINQYDADPTNDTLDLLEEWESVVHRMFRWLELMCHPDGEISFFNDSALNIAPSKEALARYSERLGIALSPCKNINLHRLDNSGYYIISKYDCYAIIDVAQT